MAGVSFRSAGIAAAGAIVGTVFTLFLSRTFFSEAQSATPARFEPPVRAQEVARGRERPNIRHDHAPRPRSTDDEEDEVEPDPSALPNGEPAERTDAEQARLDWDQQRTLIDLHQAETRDVSWARGMEQTVDETLTGLAEAHGFRTNKIECRSVTCTADVSWPTTQLAQANMSGVVQMMHLPCIKRITLPPECSPDRQCDATIVIDCTEQRTGPDAD